MAIPLFSPLPTAQRAVGRGEKNPCPQGNELRKSYKLIRLTNALLP